MPVTNNNTTTTNATTPPKTTSDNKNDNKIQQLQKEKEQPDTSLSLGKFPYPAWTFSTLCLASSPLAIRKIQGVPSYFQCMAFGAIFGFSGYITYTGDTYNGAGTSTAWSLTYLIINLPKSIKSRRPIPITLSTVALANAIIYGKESWF
ncbi:7196_t:CDS:2 [Ambispora leptoticha]|uniref:7196_t:CDS:1 n=1 Tax=Ambispora leptoticha TaxID=144679 RepID=A0A9N8Z0Q8_9GLOM|nr:7196_t:CDS:2 [Ambispora leptoticha]